MRDPKRIDIILEQIRSVWLSDPDLRLGQLLVNAARPTEPCPEIFYIENDKLSAGLTKYLSMRSATSNRDS